MTASTLPLLVLIAFLWWRSKGDLLAIVMVTSIFDAASALNVAGMPISPWLLALVICLPIKLLQGQLRWRPAAGTNRAAFLTLFLFVLYALFSSVAYPILFQGILVTNAHNGPNQHLAWSTTNISQPGYLLACFTVYLLTLNSTREGMRTAITWYVRAAITVACFSMYELARMLLHLPYPTAILYTNTTHVIFDAYKINGMWRLNSTLPEASETAFYLGTGLALLGWHLATHRIRWQSGASFLLMLVSLLLTVSTVGYACLGTIAGLGILLYVRYTFRRRAIAPVKLMLLLCLFAGAAPIFVLTNAGATVEKAINGVFINKVDSSSFRERGEMNLAAIQSSRDSYYFGAGWGSVRASSFACELMGSVGIPGAALFSLFLLQLLRPLFRRRRYARFDQFERALFAIAIMLVALLVATPDPIMPVIWMLFAVATAGKPRAAAAQPRALPLEEEGRILTGRRLVAQ